MAHRNPSRTVARGETDAQKTRAVRASDSWRSSERRLASARRSAKQACDPNHSINLRFLLCISVRFKSVLDESIALSQRALEHASSGFSEKHSPSYSPDTVSTTLKTPNVEVSIDILSLDAETRGLSEVVLVLVRARRRREPDLRKVTGKDVCFLLANTKVSGVSSPSGTIESVARSQSDHTSKSGPSNVSERAVV